jgi:hypothetical protein
MNPQIAHLAGSITDAGCLVATWRSEEETTDQLFPQVVKDRL